MTIIDPSTPWTIDPSAFHSKSRNTPYGGWEVRGRAHTVIVSGEVRYTLGGIVHEAGDGRSGNLTVPICLTALPSVS